MGNSFDRSVNVEGYFSTLSAAQDKASASPYNSVNDTPHQAVKFSDGRVFLLGAEIDPDGENAKTKAQLIASAKTKLSPAELQALGLKVI